MTDQELADKLVALGIVKCLHTKFPPSGYVYTIPDSAEAEGSASEVVRDWRVAGAVMERVYQSKRGYLGTEIYLEEAQKKLVMQFHNEIGSITILGVQSLPRAIIEAGLEALSDG